MSNCFRISLLLLVAGCVSTHSSLTKGPTSIQTAYVDKEQLQLGSQTIVDAFANQVQQARGRELSPAPTVEVRNTPALMSFSGKNNTIVVPWWGTQPSPMRAVFQHFAGGTAKDAQHFHNSFFTGFLLAHEASHWYQSKANRSEPTLYANENQANRIAVAFWRTPLSGEEFLAELEQLALRVAASVPNPTPPGEDAVTYFGANYQALGR